MNNPMNLRIIVIDDNAAIHQDFKKILTVEETSEKFDELNQLFFGNEARDNAIGLPSFQIDTAIQGEEGVKLVQQALQKKNPMLLLL